MPYPTPPAGRPLRLAFVGQRTFFEVCALGDERPGFTTRFHEFRRHGDADALRRDLDDFRPHVVVVFRPEIVPAGAFGGLRAATLGFLTEPIPRDAAGGHHDLDRRRWELERVDASSFDRVVSFDPLIAPTAESILPVWRSVPLPVSDRLYRDVRPVTGKPRALFVGRSTPHREQMLAAAKAEHPDLLHEAFGVGAADLEALLDAHDVGINIHNDTYWSFENRVCLHLAAGHLVLSEPLSPQHGLERGIDYLEVSHGGALSFLLTQLEKFPRTWHRVRVRGRLKAEQFRASRVWPRLVHDLHAELAAFGTMRT
ncbi:MAG TPA: hypothetical protein VHF89_04875 [Solirubrobacteraceae bacterium]|nr:hypothetical protein [Solirubrobacteraceae bacterium]